MKINKTLKLLAPVLILGGLVGIAALVFYNPPEADRRPGNIGPQLTVATRMISSAPYQVYLESYGTVQPRTRSQLLSQVSGQIISVNRRFRDGGFFEEGDVLLSIDPRDYEADVKISEAALMDARQVLAEEEARSEQAAYDWKRLGNEGEAPDLVLRIPQLLAAEARVISADSNFDKARLDLERTNVIAPFAGRILTKFVDVGQVVSNNARVADVYATDYVEIRLPLRDRDLAFIDLPESYRFRDVREEDMPSVIVSSALVEEERWAGKIVRTEGAIDDSARQLHVVAQIDDPFGYEGENKVPLKIGQYVTASIEGQIIPNAVVIPGSAIYQGSYAYVVDEGVLQRRDIKIAWANDTESVIRSGLDDGDELVITPLGQVISGVRVSIEGQPRNFQPPQGMNFTGDGPSNREGRPSRSGGGAKPEGVMVKPGGPPAGNRPRGEGAGPGNRQRPEGTAARHESSSTGAIEARDGKEGQS
jgi:RND family efflux transporter MFP subunit